MGKPWENQRIMEMYPLVSNMAGWKIPELNGGFNRKITNKNGSFSSQPCLITGEYVHMKALRCPPMTKEPQQLVLDYEPGPPWPSKGAKHGNSQNMTHIKTSLNNGDQLAGKLQPHAHPQ